MSDRKKYRKSGTLSNRRSHFDITALHRDDFPGQIQANPNSRAVMYFLFPIKTLKNRCLITL